MWCLKYIITDSFRKEKLTLSIEIFPKINSSKITKENLLLPWLYLERITPTHSILLQYSYTQENVSPILTLVIMKFLL